MNRNRYRLVFNKLRSLPMAVAETATGQGKHSSESRPHSEKSDDCLFGLLTRTRRGGACLLLGVAVLQAMPLQALAQIVVDRNAPKSQQPTVLNASNGVPQINIQTPNGNGVSRNTFTQFDVSSNGVILNNSRIDIQTQLGGWVQGNPWLAAGTAKVILNEVNSNNPSLLKGYIEVAGDRAQVVIANPSGISCDGCGFVNANRATLTTGTPVFGGGGSLDAYRVQGGIISIDGAGMDASRADYTDIIARGVQINAGLWANNLKITAGANQVNAAHSSATPIAGTGAAPTYAIDVAALGGMYAGKIYLVGTESGLGVRNAGQIGASAGEVVVTADGRLENSGKIISTASTTVQAKGSVQNSGTVMAGTDLTVTTQGDLQNTGALMAHGNASFTANGTSSQITGSTDSLFAAGVQSDGTLGTQGNLSLAATQSIAASGQNVAGGDQTLQAAGIDLSNSQTSGRNVSLSATQDNAKLTGATVSASQTLTIATPQTLQSDGATISANQLSLFAHDISNVGGTLLQVGSGDLDIQLAGSLDNTRGLIGTNSQRLNITAGALNNTQGDLEHAGTGSFTLRATSYAGTQGTISSNGTLDLTADTVTLDGGSVSAQQLGITAGTVSNRSGVIAQLGTGQAALIATTALDNTGGTVGSNGSLILQTGTLGNVGGTLQSVTDLTINASGAVDNSASDASIPSLISAGGDAQITASQLNNTLGKINVAGSGQWTIAGALVNKQGHLTVGQNLSLSAGTLDNTQGVLGAVAGNASLTIGGLLTNTGGWVESGGGTTLDTQGLANGNGTILSQRLSVESHGQAVDNQGGALVASGDTLSVNSGALANDGGLIQAKGALTLNTGTLSNKNAGSSGGIQGLANVSITSSAVDNTSGYVAGNGDVAITTAGNLINGQGVLASGGKFQLTGTGLSNGGGQIQAVGDLGIDLGTGTLDNSAGLIRTSGIGTIAAAIVKNLNTQPTALTTNLGLEGKSLTVTATQIDNTAGALRASDTISLTAANTIDNSQGHMTAGNTLALQNANVATPSLSITNTQGTLLAGKQVTIKTASLSGDGDILSGGNIGINLTQDYTHSGNLEANDDISLTTVGILKNQGFMQAGGTLALQAATLDNQAAGILEGTTLQLRATDTHTFTNRGLINGSDTFIDAVTLNNLGTGRIYGDHIALSATTLNNTRENGVAPVIAARSWLDLGVGTLNNLDGALIYSAGDMSIGGALDENHKATGAATLITNSSATIEADGNLAIKAAQTTNKRTTFKTTQTITSEGAEYVLLFWGPAGPKATFLASWAKNSTTTVTEDSGAGRISSGGNMSLTGAVTNDKSDILAGGSIVLDQAKYKGISQQGQALKSAIGATFFCACGGGFVGYTGYFVLGDPYDLFSDDTARNSILGVAGALGSVVTPSILQWWSKAGVQFTWDTLVGYSGMDLWGNPIFSTTYADGLSPVYETTDLTQSLRWGQLDPYSASNIVLKNYSLAPARLTANKSITGTATQIANLNVGGTVGQIGSGAKSANVTVGTGKTFTPIAQVTVPNSSGSTPGSGTVIRSGGINLTLPTNSLYTLHSGKSSGPLIETDPRFTNRNTWLSSDYMLKALSLDPAVTQKRLGDGYYEQQLIREQVAQLTGRRFLDGYANEEAEYQGLMNAGVTFAKAHNLVPGVTLSAEQMAQLTSDIVWLVEQTVTLPDGTQQKVLVPQLYVQVKEGDLSNDGALIAANDISLKISGDLTNGGAIAGRNVVDLSANNIDIEGRIKGKYVGLTAANDINVTGGEVRADSLLALDAGRDINVTSTTTDYTAGSATYLHSTTTMDRVAGLYVTGSEGKLIAQANRDITLTGAQVDSAGTAALGAGRNLTLNTLATQETLNFQNDEDNFDHNRSTNEAGTTLKSQGDLSLFAGNDLIARAATLGSANGAVSLEANRDILLLSGEATFTHEGASKDAPSKSFSKSLTQDTTAIGTVVTAGTDMTIKSGRDTVLQGSAVEAAKDLTLNTGGDLQLLSATNTHTQSEQSLKIQSTQIDNLSFELEQNRAILSTITVGGKADIGIGGNLVAQAGTRDADGNLEADRMTAHGIEKGTDRQQVTMTGNAAKSDTSQVLGNLAAKGIRANANDSFAPTAVLSGQDAMNALVQSGLVKLKNDPEIQKVLAEPSPSGKAMTYTDPSGRIKLTVSGEAKVQQIYSTLRLNEKFDIQHIPDAGMAQAVTLIVAIVLTVCTAGAGAALIGAASGTATAAAANAAFIAMTSTMTGQLAAGASPSDALEAGVKAGITSAITAAASYGINDSLGMYAHNPDGSVMINNGAPVMSTAGETFNKLSALDKLGTSTFWKQAAMNAGVQGALGAAQGGDFGTSFANSMVGSLGQTANTMVGDWAKNNGIAGGDWSKVLLHSGIGAVQATLTGQDAMAGAIGGGTAELLSPLGDKLDKATGNKIASELLTVGGAMLANAAFNPKGDLTTSLTAANQALQTDRFNRQLHPDQIARIHKINENNYEREQQELAVLCYAQNCNVDGTNGKLGGSAAQMYQAGEQLKAANPQLFNQLLGEINADSTLLQGANQYGWIDKGADLAGRAYFKGTGQVIVDVAKQAATEAKGTVQDAKDTTKQVAIGGLMGIANAPIDMANVGPTVVNGYKAIYDVATGKDYAPLLEPIPYPDATKPTNELQTVGNVLGSIGTTSLLGAGMSRLVEAGSSSVADGAATAVTKSEGTIDAVASNPTVSTSMPKSVPSVNTPPSPSTPSASVTVAADTASVGATAENGASQVVSSAPNVATSPTPIAQPVSKVDDLFGKTFDSVPITHIEDTQNGKLGEQLGLQLLNDNTGLNFKPLQNTSNHGCDGCAFSIQDNTIWVADVKSSQAGVDAAKEATGDPATRLRGWLDQEWASGNSASPENQALAAKLQEAITGGAQVKGITVKVGVPSPGTTGTAEFKVLPWED